VKAPVIVLLTSDPALENVVADALLATGGISHLARNPGDALKIVCGTGRDLHLAVIDFEHGPHGMTLLKAISTCREDFPVIVIMHEDEKHVEALAYANGAAACLPKPISAAQFAEAMKECRRSQHQHAIA
jgi:DNA-binding NtrC family response regulator